MNLTQRGVAVGRRWRASLSCITPVGCQTLMAPWWWRRAALCFVYAARQRARLPCRLARLSCATPATLLSFRACERTGVLFGQAPRVTSSVGACVFTSWARSWATLRGATIIGSPACRTAAIQRRRIVAIHLGLTFCSDVAIEHGRRTSHRCIHTIVVRRALSTPRRRWLSALHL